MLSELSTATNYSRRAIAQIRHDQKIVWSGCSTQFSDRALSERVTVNFRECFMFPTMLFEVDTALGCQDLGETLVEIENKKKRHFLQF